MPGWASSGGNGEPSRCPGSGDGRGQAHLGRTGGWEAGRLLQSGPAPAQPAYSPRPSRPGSHQFCQTSKGDWERTERGRVGRRGHPFLPLSHWIQLSAHLSSLSHDRGGRASPSTRVTEQAAKWADCRLPTCCLPPGRRPSRASLHLDGRTEPLSAGARTRCAAGTRAGHTVPRIPALRLSRHHSGPVPLF